MMLDRTTHIRSEAPTVKPHVFIIDGVKHAYNLRGRPSGARAIIATAIHEGRVVLNKPTFRQAAALCDCSASYVYAASLLNDEERRAVLDGRRPLVPPQQQLENAIRRAGVETAWNMIVRILEEVAP